MRQSLGIPTQHHGRAWPYAPGSSGIAMHRHEELEFNLVTAGQARYLFTDRRYDLAPGTLIWLFPDHDHLLIDQTPDYRMWIVVIRPEALRRLCHGESNATLLQRDPKGEISRQLHADDARSLSSLLRRVEAAADDPDRSNAGLGYVVLEAWAMFQRAESLTVSQEVHPAVERAAYLLSTEGDDLSIEQIARRSGLSSSRLSRLFRQQTGLTLVAYRNRRRVERFIESYGRGRRRTITEAALDAGFGSYPQFHRVFREVMNQSPADYRRSIEHGET